MRLGPFLEARSLHHGAASTEEASKQTPLPTKPAAQTAVERYYTSESSCVPTPTPTAQPNSNQTSNGLDPATKIGLETGITLGTLVLIVTIGFCIYSLTGRSKVQEEADEDAEIRSCEVEPGTPHSSMPELTIPQTHQVRGHRYLAVPNHMNPALSEIQPQPTAPQTAPVVLDRWGRADHSSQPLMNAAELEDAYTWNRHPRVSELNPTPSSYRKSVYPRPAELDNNHAGDPKPVHQIPRKQVASYVQVPRPEPRPERHQRPPDMAQQWI